MDSDRLFERAHEASRANRSVLSRSKVCGCFHCGQRFKFKAIRDWEPNPEGDDTAKCPACKFDSVIGDASGFPVTKEFLKRMHGHWFK